jgi:hypothetical protein
VGYVIYSFQLFPISRISNRWLYIFVYSFAVETDSYRARFDTSDAIILPMVQKGKVEETMLESVPQLIIQLINGYLLGEIAKMPVFAVFSISLSLLSLSSTTWYYAYWNLFRCRPIRDVPSSLSLYNYKLSGVKEGMCSFGKPSHDVNEIEVAEMDKFRSVTIANSVLNEDSTHEWPDSDKQDSSLPKKTRAAPESEIEVASPEQIHLEAELNEARAVIKQLEAETLRIADEHKRVKGLLLRLSVSSAHSAAAAPSVEGALTGIQDQSHDAVPLILHHRYDLLTRNQVRLAAVKVQSVMRGHFGRCTFRARCISATKELMDDNGDNISDGV